MKLKFTVQGKPISDNLAYGYARFGRYLKTEGKDYKKRFTHEALVAKNLLSNGWRMDSPMRLTIQLFFKDRVKRDCQNFGKLICDAMNGCVYNDDSQIQEIIIRKYIWPETQPFVDIEVEEIEP